MIYNKEEQERLVNLIEQKQEEKIIHDLKMVIKNIPDNDVEGDLDPRVKNSLEEAVKAMAGMPKIEPPKSSNEIPVEFIRSMMGCENIDISNGIETIDKTIQGRNGEIPLKIYTSSKSEKMPAIVFIHGGAFFGGSTKTVENACKYLAEKIEGAVVSVDYRLCPEYRFPQGLHDCFDTVKWLYEKAKELNVNKDAIGVSGDSAGGNLMLIKKIQLWEDNEHVNLFTYILDNSMEFKKDEKKPAVIICPGGGYLGTSDREAEPVAMKFAAQGYHTFVLRYNTYFTEWVSDFNNLPEGNEKSAYPGPLFDLAKAMIVIKENADEWFVDSNKISICGFSAGAHLTASMGVHWQDNFLKAKFGVDSETFKPNALILGYPLLDYEAMKEKLEVSPDKILKGFFETSKKAVFGKANPTDKELAKLSPVNYVTTNTPPTFIWHTANDEMVYVANSLNFAAQLTKNKIPYELHVFESGPHGLSLCDETTAREERHINPHCSVWFDLAISWLKKY